MNINVLKDYCTTLTDDDADALLSCWGVWVNTAREHLGYKRPSYAINAKGGSSACIWLNDKELELIDKAIGMTQYIDHDYLAVLISKFVYRMSMRAIVKKHGLKSTNKLYGILRNGKYEFKQFLKNLVEDYEENSKHA